MHFILGFLQFPSIFSRSFWKALYSYTVNFGIHGIRQAIKYGESSILNRLHDKREFNWLIDISPAGTHEESLQVLEASVDDDPIQGYTELPGIHFLLSKFDSCKTSSLSWYYIRAKYTHFAVHFVRWQVLKQPYQITALSYHLCFFIICWMDFCVVKNYAKWFTL